MPNVYDWNTGINSVNWPQDMSGPQVDPRQIAALGGPAGSVDAATAQAPGGSRLMDLAISRQLQQAKGKSESPMGKVAMRRKELMGQGMSQQGALLQMSKEGLVDPRIVEKMLSVANAVPGV